jgi:transcriptional regulator PpsR
MVESSVVTPDITITLDSDGLVQKTVSSEALADESLDQWRGRPWGEIVDPAITNRVSQMIDDVRRNGATSYLHVKQRFPSGRELEMEYTTISLGKRAGFVAVGRNIQTISDLQSRLVLAHQAREQDYWKIREIETRYRLLFDATSEAVLLVRVANLKIVEANLAASKALGLLPGSEFHPELQQREKKSFQDMLHNVRESGRAPGIVLHFGKPSVPWSLRASLMNSDTGAFYLFQLAPIGGGADTQEDRAQFSIDDLIRRLPDAFVVLDRGGMIRSANDAFLDIAQIGSEEAVIGQQMKRWLSSPGADATVVLGLVAKHGSVRNLATTICGELGSNTEVELSAAGNKEPASEHVCVVLRDVTRKETKQFADSEQPAPPLADSDDLGATSLEQLVKAATESIEKRSIVAALKYSGGNRTVAAKRLGLSRQSLHMKLNKYNFDEM